jgi:hypothetical protein
VVNAVVVVDWLVGVEQLSCCCVFVGLGLGVDVEVDTVVADELLPDVATADTGAVDELAMVYDTVVIYGAVLKATTCLLCIDHYIWQRQIFDCHTVLVLDVYLCNLFIYLLVYLLFFFVYLFIHSFIQLLQYKKKKKKKKVPTV